MSGTRSEGYLGPYLGRRVQQKRLMAVMRSELTACQRRAIVGYYLENKTITQLAQEYGVNKTTIWRTLRRGEDRLRRYLRY